jgi:hypothetical protein
LRGAGAEKIFRETASGARADRVQLRRVLSQLDKGDVLMVTRLDRLARSTRYLRPWGVGRSSPIRLYLRSQQVVQVSTQVRRGWSTRLIGS